MSDECCARTREESEKECSEYCTHLESQLKAANEKVEIYKDIVNKSFQFINHSEQCNSHVSWAKKCSCGLDKFDKELREAIAKVEALDKEGTLD